MKLLGSKIALQREKKSVILAWYTWASGDFKTKQGQKYHTPQAKTDLSSMVIQKIKIKKSAIVSRSREK